MDKYVYTEVKMTYLYLDNMERKLSIYHLPSREYGRDGLLLCVYLLLNTLDCTHAHTHKGTQTQTQTHAHTHTHTSEDRHCKL